MKSLEKTKSNNIIIFRFEEAEFKKCFIESLSYALLSFPFTINRMGFEDTRKRIENIIKGKLAEKLFFLFMEESDLLKEVKSTETPFYQVDRRDFIFRGYEWDIKNNYFHCEEVISNIEIMEEFYGLIPNRNTNDQWSKFCQNESHSSYPPAILFTFLHKLDFAINLSKELIKFLDENFERFGGRPINSYPEEYVKELRLLLLQGNISYNYNFENIKNYFYITGFVTVQDKDRFIDLEANSRFPKDKDCFITKIRNKAIPIRETWSFKSFLSQGYQEGARNE